MNDFKAIITFYSGRTLVMRVTEMSTRRYTTVDVPGYKEVSWTRHDRSEYDMLSLDPARVESVVTMPWTMFDKEGIS